VNLSLCIAKLASRSHKRLTQADITSQDVDGPRPLWFWILVKDQKTGANGPIWAMWHSFVHPSFIPFKWHLFKPSAHKCSKPTHRKSHHLSIKQW